MRAEAARISLRNSSPKAGLFGLVPLKPSFYVGIARDIRENSIAAHLDLALVSEGPARRSSTSNASRPREGCSR
jgi:hypothetical protein